MSAVNVLVNGRSYNIACNDGEEEHLQRLAAMVDAKLIDLVKMVGQIGDQRLMLMAGLLLADELVSERTGKGDLNKAMEALKAANLELKAQADAAEGEAAAALEAAARRVETVISGLS
jgi:cell division protein ZapA